jgi:hypothetical protein
MAAECARRLCGLQGPQGQWWRAYDVRKGTVAERYPVYAVNQDGAMPAALTLLARVAPGPHLEEASRRGLHWLFGANELGVSLVDEEHGVLLGGIGRQGEDFELLREMRAYHPGRCLHALALAESTARSTR